MNQDLLICNIAKLPDKEFFVHFSCKSPLLANYCYYYFFENIGDDKMGQKRSKRDRGWKNHSRFQLEYLKE